MTQILGTETVKRRISPKEPVRVPSLETQAPRLILRALIAQDIPVLAALIERESAHLFRWLPIPDQAVGGEQIATHWVNQSILADETGWAWRRIATLTDGTIVGGVNLIRIERGLDWQADLNWWVSSARSGLGIGTELVREALAHAFADMPTGLGLHRVHAGIQRGNAASLRVAEKAGFVEDSALDSRLLVNDEWQLHHGFVARV